MKPKNNNSDMVYCIGLFNQMYSWILNKKTESCYLAINLYVYLNRKETKRR